MISRLLPLILLLTSLQLLGQANTEVYLFDLDLENGSPVLTNPKNISNNHGYDNQPSFWDDNTLLFASTRSDQTDIIKFNIEAGSTSSWITNTPTGSEYSPLKIPGKDAVSSIRLDLDGLQLLYNYNVSSGKSKAILPNQKVGYHVWFNADILVTSVLVNNRMDLVVNNVKDGSRQTIARSVGRSFHKIPNTQLVSYISKAGENWEILSLDPKTGQTKKIAEVLHQSEDLCWLDQTTILTGIGKSLFKLNTSENKGWEEVIQFDLDEINNISRIAVNPGRNRLAFVAEVSPLQIINRQVETFNNRDLFGFVSCYTEDVVVERFPDQPMYTGREKMTDNYDRFYQNTKDAKVEVVNRIRLGNTVIDEEISMVDGRKGHQVAIYEVENGFIASMRFIFPERETVDSESIVQTQLDAYNARNIDAFMATYSDDVQLYNFPNKLSQGNRSKMKEAYQNFFKANPNLHCEIKNRIVIGNKVIDEELVTLKDSQIRAVAVYEVEDGKISRVTFIR
ncbi:nuclear transport factor 2 family protein [Flagellimonas myxillae]|uniref:nuclear transport factor 2 family protein n=1 Tax=Flagellimonas myxillae TaxID=2942214 RepID=UPI00201F872D|nr:nuclear transport factor 2 family protein [Muricauda myxillae]MCL6265531.1 nuclear transport factor 2 family protein [Muricauda myxillae]